MPVSLARCARMVAVVCALVSLTNLPARAAQDSCDAYELRGTIGKAEVGANMTIRNHDEFVDGHYFYANRLVDIPLSGEVKGQTITLREPGGGVFDLHFVGNGSEGKKALDFYTSVALTGTWTQGDRTLPAKLNLDFGAQGSAQDWYLDVTDEATPLFEARVARFLDGVVRGEKKQAAAAVSYPLRVNGKKTFEVHDAKELLARWNEIFTPAYVDLLRKAIPHEMFIHEGMAMVGNGAAWFDAKGASVLNPPSSR
jgi:hypothetical protein